MLQFTNLRLNGFKSFVDRTDLEIGPGLTGIVGPNGCGKSNLVEALRWVMGEGSAKQMRGSGMEDVIFSGTAKRAARNFSEVVLSLDNSSRTASPAYNNSDEIEIIRRIERDKGSGYKINGKNTRARDVQMLLADTVTGANSPALVSQGRITRIINAKPLERRLVLEDSAGISGLFSRRHEAELRLKAADANMERMEDLVQSLESQINALKRQARQATKYRNISAQIRELEILVAYLEWAMLNNRVKDTKCQFQRAEKEVADHLTTVTQLTKTQNTQSEALPELRKKEAESAAALQNKTILLHQLEKDQERHESHVNEAQNQYEQAKKDLEHEKASLKDVMHSLEALKTEQKQILDQEQYSEEKLQEKEKRAESLQIKVNDLEGIYNAELQNEAEKKAQLESLKDTLQKSKNRLSQIELKRTQAQDHLDTLLKDRISPADISKKENIINNITSDIEVKSKERDALFNRIEQAKEGHEGQLKAVEERRTELNDIATEITLIEKLLNQDSAIQDEHTALNLIQPESGFEKALSRALGDSLLGQHRETTQSIPRDKTSDHDGSSSYWRMLNDKPANAMPALPASAAPLLEKVKAPPLYHRALSQIGLVKNADEGEKLQPELQPGQSLVTMDGGYWRWDGYCVSDAALDRNAQYLELRNQLKSLQEQRPVAEADLEKAVASHEKNKEELRILHVQADTLASEIKALEATLKQDTKALYELKNKSEIETQKIERFRQDISGYDPEIHDLRQDIQDHETKLGHLQGQEGDNKSESNTIEERHAELTQMRKDHQDALQDHDRALHQKKTRQARLQAIADDLVSLKNRSIRSTNRLKDIEARKEELEKKLKDLKKEPSNFEDKRDSFLNDIAQLEKIRDDHAATLAGHENEVHSTNKALREAEGKLGTAKEKRAGAQALLSSLQDQINGVASDIQAKYEMPPHTLPDHLSVKWQSNEPVSGSGDNENEIVITQSMIDTYKKQRDEQVSARNALGPVNLRADHELEEIEKELASLLHERHDLQAAIQELRGGIQKINKEARARLLSAFELVNAHFKTLFGRLFQGGNAYLSLVDSDDPLESGLEIFAQPPGKSLQSLSLLSGGEQTLTSIALIFAMFLTNPSPICVLDEIDAPLDDANVDRLCYLLEEIAERGETRFLIVTHHRMTMARMHRLYGVTMAEKGVSQLVSVDLQQSFNFLDKAA